MRLLSVLLFTALLAPSSAWAGRNLASVLTEIGLDSHKLGSLAVSRDFKRTGKEKTFRTIIAQSKEVSLEIEILEPIQDSDADEYEKSRFQAVEQLYEDQVTPYRGQVTNMTVCPPEMKPKKVSARVLDRDISILLANATDRNTFGVWDPSVIKKVGVIAVARDPQAKRILRFKVFFPSKGFDPNQAIAFFSDLKRTAVKSQ